MYKCEKCKQKVPATKQYKIERPPMVLCIQLKRFNLMGGKNGRPVTLARKLSITNHVRWAPAKAIAIEYKLDSMITHVGPSPNCGHYTSIGEAGNGTFYRFDDASVHPTSLQNALNTSAYVIFYEMLPKTKSAILSPQQTPQSSKLSSASPQLKPRQDGSSEKLKTEPKSPQTSMKSPQLSSNSSNQQPRLIGPQLPTPIKNRPTLITEPVKTLPKPKIISEPPKQPNTSKAVDATAKKTPMKTGLVPYGEDSSSDDDANTTPSLSSKSDIKTTPTQSEANTSSQSANHIPKPTSPSVKHISTNQCITPNKDSSKPSTSSLLKTESPQQSPITSSKVSSSKPPSSPSAVAKSKTPPSPNNLGDKKSIPTISSPFLPRSVAANLKKIK